MVTGRVEECCMVDMRMGVLVVTKHVFCVLCLQAELQHTAMVSVTNPTSMVGLVGLCVVLVIGLALVALLSMWDRRKSAKLEDVARVSFLSRGLTEVENVGDFNKPSLAVAKHKRRAVASRKQATAGTSRSQRLAGSFCSSLKQALARKHPVLALVLSPLHHQTIMSRSARVWITVARALAAMCAGALFFGLDTGTTLLEWRGIVGARGALLAVPFVVLLPPLLKVGSTATSSTVWLRTQEGKTLAYLAPKLLRKRRSSSVVSFRAMLWNSGLLTPGRRAVRDITASQRRFPWEDKDHSIDSPAVKPSGSARHDQRERGHGAGKNDAGKNALWELRYAEVERAKFNYDGLEDMLRKGVTTKLQHVCALLLSHTEFAQIMLERVLQGHTARWTQQARLMRRSQRRPTPQSVSTASGGFCAVFHAYSECHGGTDLTPGDEGSLYNIGQVPVRMMARSCTACAPYT